MIQVVVVGIVDLFGESGISQICSHELVTRAGKKARSYAVLRRTLVTHPLTFYCRTRHKFGQNI